MKKKQTNVKYIKYVRILSFNNDNINKITTSTITTPISRSMPTQRNAKRVKKGTEKKGKKNENENKRGLFYIPK